MYAAVVNKFRRLSLWKTPLEHVFLELSNIYLNCDIKSFSACYGFIYGFTDFMVVYAYIDRLCGLVVRLSGYRSRGPSSIPGDTRFSEK
jgi:hypothetical protein